MTRPLLLLALVALGGCAELGAAQDIYRGRLPDRYPGRDRSADSRADDYSRTTEYRRITADAADYARRVGDALRLQNQQEDRIRDLLVDRTARLLQRTRARDHRDVYPFPRDFGSSTRATRSFWATADRDIERILGRRDADLYRRYVRTGGRYDDSGYRYDDRDGQYRDGQARDGGNWGRDDGERGDDRRREDRRDDDDDDDDD